ncbi:GNAT family N-acetyltransferase [Ahrensia sp. R2A130]|uniref:GNAT family N-acetyltransferase n=1 Tax=Ahrensia sp. R2A130 TaxID=744979 RepID=UPI0001E0D099|nr:GNAT family N-acetyltransferase [Ahrensia sp. R2A130]EFL90280.1 GCN5-related N-acetyltransferase [Ahrensia sp. R2A130]
MSVVVRRAHGTEVADARDLTNRSWLSTYPALIGQAETEEIITTRHSADVFREQAARIQDRFLVALQGEKVVGHLYAFQKDGMYVDRLHVDPQMKGLGIGKALLGNLEQQLFPDSRIWLDVLRGNDDAIRFYETVGYTRDGETDACGGLAGISAIIFDKTVG